MVTLSTLVREDVEAVAALHRQAFPNFFLSSLGEPFLVQFYRGFLGDPTAVAVVAHDDLGRVRGAAVGTVRPAAFFRRLLGRRLLGFGLASMRAVATQPSAAPRLMAAVRYRGGVGAESGCALLSSICVDPDHQGGGVGRALLMEWSSRAARLGSHCAELTTDAEDNRAANRFYLSCGWRMIGSFQTREGRSMNRYRIELEGHA